ncbi:MAG: pyruvate, phosphate dikinase [Desulfovibrio sp.]|nr:pyruvate, phosphate dikinase [Desulfovibrio sp.]
MSVLNSLKKLFTGHSRQSRQDAMSTFATRYESFKELLDCNADLAGILARLDAAQRGELTMEMRLVRKEARRAIVCCERMAYCLNAISNNRHKRLEETVAALGKRIEHELEQHAQGDITELVLGIGEIDAGLTYSVGAKSANLGELSNALDLPVPKGFAITIQAGVLHLLRNSGLFRKMHIALRAVDPEDPESIQSQSAKVRNMITEAPVPPDVASAIHRAWDTTFGSRDVMAALRSSAIAEDGAQSFAGQYLSVLGVTRDTLLDAFKKVLASLYSTRAIAYRASNGYPLEASGMGMCCLEMVRAKAAGVAFSRHPVDVRSNEVVINGLWGLGEMVVDGSATPDQWLVSRDENTITSEKIAEKRVRLVLKRKGNTCEEEIEDVPLEFQLAPCLTEDQVETIAAMALKLEHHYQYPQDMEWAVDEDDDIILLQTRPMSMDTPVYDNTPAQRLDTPPIFSGADVAARGVAAGPVFHVEEGDDMTKFPQGAVMVLRHSSPTAMVCLKKAAAIIAETGSLTGHMASICREFHVPTLLNIPNVFNLLEDGMVVTVDAISGRVFMHEIPELLSIAARRETPRVDSPAHVLLRRIAAYVLPLHLVDPHSKLFTPENCTSLHDVMRYAHEYSYSSMFLLSDSLSDEKGGATVRLVCNVPLDLYMIDVGGGLREGVRGSARPEDVTSTPMHHVLNGMLDPDVQAKGPRPVNMRGFLSVVGRSMTGSHLEGGQRFGSHSYAIISDCYLNFSSRVGYHYAILDAWCSDALNKNYIRFEFAGGAAGNEQRSRRVRCIGMILTSLGFNVEIVGDRLRARYQKYPRGEMLDRLTQIGRLLIMTRQMDMLMVDEDSVSVFANNFLSGKYH